MTEDELENFILKYLSERKFLKTQKKLSSASRKRRKSHANNFILEERFEKLKKHFFNVQENDNNNSTNISEGSKPVNDGDSSGTDTDFEEIDNFYQAHTRNDMKIRSYTYEWYATYIIYCIFKRNSTILTFHSISPSSGSWRHMKCQNY